MMNQLIIALMLIESGGDANAIGDNGDAYGILQIHEAYVQDVNRIAKTSFEHRDAMNPRTAGIMARVYLYHYGRRYERLTGKKPTAEVYARIHNGGPNGYKKTATLKYWNKVRRELAK